MFLCAGLDGSRCMETFVANERRTEKQSLPPRHIYHFFSSHSPLFQLCERVCFHYVIMCSRVLVTLVYHSVIISIRAFFPFICHLLILFSIWITLRSLCSHFSHFSVNFSFIVLLNTSALWGKPPRSFIIAIL